MEPSRHFLGWQQPLLASVTGFLERNHPPDQKRPTWDLSRLLIVVPTRNAGRLLREHLAVRAAEWGAGVLSPRILTPESLVNTCLPQHPPLATDAQALAIWSEVLQGARLDDFATLFPVQPPEQNHDWACSIGRQIDRLRSSLAEAGLGIAEIHARAGMQETGRWEELTRLEKLWHAALARAGLADEHRTKAKHSGLVWAWDVDRIILAGVCDPLPLAIDFLAAQALPVDSLVWAPEERAEDFDAWGRVCTGQWSSPPIGIPEPSSRIHGGPSPRAQVDKVIALLPAHARPCETLALGVADSALAGPLAKAIEAAGIPAFLPEGRSVTHHPLHRLLAAVNDLLRSREWPAFTALLRFPVVLDALDATPRLLAALDSFQAAHLPQSFTDAPALATADGNHREFGSERWVAEIARRVDGILADLEKKEFPEALAELLARLHHKRDFQNSRPGDAEFAEVAARVMALAQEIQQVIPGAATRDKLALLLDSLGADALPGERKPDAVELSGWLELPWQDAPHLVVAGFNDQHVPAAPAPDPFLPESLRESLGLRCHKQRVARDSYLLTALIESRRENGRVDLIFSLAGSDGEPQKPSRLLMRCSDEELPARVRMLFQDSPPAGIQQPRLAWKLAPVVAASRVERKRFRVTSFADYLACPFRYLLQHGLGMESVEAGAQELDAAGFGNLCHAAFEFLASDDKARGSADPRVITKTLLEGFERDVNRLYGPRHPLSLKIQFEAARQRLRTAADVQAQTRSEGWLIQSAETNLSSLRGTPFMIAGIEVTGRVDRIEIHEPTGAWRIIDYKTSAKAQTPIAAHTGKAKKDSTPERWRVLPDGKTVWKGLQLPLYGAALREKFGPDYQAAYFNLPKALKDTGISPWPELDSAALDSALECAKGVLDAIRRRIFWPPAEKPQWDNFGSLWLGSVTECVEAPLIVPDPPAVAGEPVPA